MYAHTNDCIFLLNAWSKTYYQRTTVLELDSTHLEGQVKGGEKT